MKSNLLEVIDFFKSRNLALKNEVENDYKEYTLLCKYNSNNKITITDQSIEAIDDGEKTTTAVFDNKTIYNFIHLYLAKSMLKGTNAYRYDIFIVDKDNNVKKVGFFEQDKPTSNKRMIIVCPNEEVVAMIREELIANYNYIIINEPIERILGL